MILVPPSFSSLCQLYIFCGIIDHQYVKTKFYLSKEIVANIALTVFALNFKSFVRDILVVITLDDIFQQFINILSVFLRIISLGPLASSL